MTTTNTCLECDRKFATTAAAEKAWRNGCPRCGGSDIDLYEPKPTQSRLDATVNALRDLMNRLDRQRKTLQALKPKEGTEGAALLRHLNQK